MPYTSHTAQIKNVITGNDVVIIEPANVYGCTLGDAVFIGPFVEIQANTVIGRGTKIQSHSFVCEYVTVGEECFIGHGVMFANDMFRDGKPGPDRDSWARIVVGNHVSIGSGATILAVTLCDWRGHRCGQRGDERYHRERRVCGESGETAAFAIAIKKAAFAAFPLSSHFLQTRITSRLAVRKR
jgi:NDP-sugar pyrophosphorylase family protein